MQRGDAQWRDRRRAPGGRRVPGRGPAGGRRAPGRRRRRAGRTRRGPRCRPPSRAEARNRTGRESVRAWRSRITTVPAARSPRRWLRRVARADRMARAPAPSRKSTMPSADRMAACRNRMGAPSRVTTRRPMAALPGVRPFHAVSNAAGYTRTAAKSVAMDSTTSSVSPNDRAAGGRGEEHGPDEDRPHAEVDTKASERLPRPASANSSRTASGVTMPSWGPSPGRPPGSPAGTCAAVEAGGDTAGYRTGHRGPGPLHRPAPARPGTAWRTWPGGGVGGRPASTPPSSTSWSSSTSGSPGTCPTSGPRTPTRPWRPR